MQLPPSMADVDLACFDVDGTLAAADHKPTPRTLRALADLTATGIQIVVITGRALPQAQAVFRDAGISGVAIASNGSIAAEGPDGPVLSRTVLPPDEVEAVLNFVEGRELEAVLFTDDEHHVKQGSVVADLFREINPEVHTIEMPRTQVRHETVIKACITGHPETLDALDAEVRAAFPRVVRSMTSIFDVFPDGADKGATLREYLTAIDVDPGRVLGVGDSENDVTWLKAIGHPIAVANAVPEVKAVAELEIGHHDEESVAELIEALIAARRG